jgi:poly [ADP-ribose] polymerase
VRKGDFGYTFQRVVESYLMIVPTKVGRKLRPREVLGTLDKVEEQSQILDSMEAVGGSVEVETDEEVFAVELSEADGGTVRDIQKLVEKTSSRGHRSYGMKVKRVYKVKIENDDYEGGSNEWMLWHGTKASNLLSILRKGLVIVPRGASHTTGRMYGDGLYFSDQSTKALNYATTFWGGRDEGRYFMLICRVAMGKAYTPDRYGCRKPPRGYDSVYAKGGQSGVINNEMVVYRESQARIEYIVEFSK